MKIPKQILNSLIASLSVICSTHALMADTKKPNVVVFLVDDLGYMDVGANNPKCFYETPNVDALAKSGMRFTDGYAANPVCSPTRYALMTGKYPKQKQKVKILMQQTS